MKYTLIVPSIVETAVTGFALAAEKTIGKTVWCIEYWRGDAFPRVFKNSTRQASLSICPINVIKFGNAVAKQYIDILKQ